MKHEVLANKTKLGAEDALGLARRVTRIVVAKGKKAITFDMKSPPDDKTLLNPDFPGGVSADGMIRAGFPFNPRVFGQSGRTTQWVTGENRHFAFNLTAN